MPKMMRWQCPNCKDGCLAPSRPRKDDSRIYCFPCSEKTGRLVHRVAPAQLAAAARAQQRAEAAKAAQAAKRAEARAAAQVVREQEVAARHQLRQMPISEVAKLSTHAALLEAVHRYTKLKAWERALDVRVEIRRRPKPYATGHAYMTRRDRDDKEVASGRISVTAGSDLADAHATILHELAHIAAGTGHGHDFRWWSFFMLATKELTGIEPTPVAPNRFEMHHSVQRVVALYLFPTESVRG